MAFAMFDGAELIKDYVSEDYLCDVYLRYDLWRCRCRGLPHLTTANSPLADYPAICWITRIPTAQAASAFCNN